MSRIKSFGPEVPPLPENAWVCLNHRFFGSDEIGGHCVVPKLEALPVNWTEIFGRDAPKTLEVGFNRGVFLQELAERWPDCDHVGIEIRRRFAWHLVNEIGSKKKQSNIRVLWADAKNVVQTIFAPESLSHMFITFPDPWWKARHAKRRLVDLDFARNIVSMLKKEGRVWVKSDVPAISEEISAALTACPELKGPIPFAQDDLPLTYRERRCLAQNLEIYRFYYEKTV